MTNMQRLAQDGGRNHQIFAATVLDLMNSQGFYGRLYRTVNGLDSDDYDSLFSQLERQNFTDMLDVIFWLEC